MKHLWGSKFAAIMSVFITHTEQVAFVKYYSLCGNIVLKSYFLHQGQSQGHSKGHHNLSMHAKF